MHPLVRIFNFVWFGGLALFGGMTYLTSGWNALSGKSGEGLANLLELSSLGGMLIFGIGLVRFGRYLARDDSRFLVDFLIQTLDARPGNDWARVVHEDNRRV